jgi:hypothetical protein
MGMRHRQHQRLFVKDAINDAKRKLMKNVTSVAGNVHRPTFRTLFDSLDRQLKFAFEIYGGGGTSFGIPSK